MSNYLIILISVFSFIKDGGINSISKQNELKQKAQLAYNKQDYSNAIKYYEVLRDSFNINTPALNLNLAQA